MATLTGFAKIAGGSANAVGPLKVDSIQFTGGGTYTTGGNPGLRAGLDALFKDGRTPVSVVQLGSTGDYELYYIPSTGLLQIVVRSTGVELANTVDLAAVTFKALVISQ